MITEWQPIMPDDVLTFKKRTLIELLFKDKHTEIEVGLGDDKKVKGSDVLTGKIVAWREYDCRAERLRDNPPVVADTKKK